MFLSTFHYASVKCIEREILNEKKNTFAKLGSVRKLGLRKKVVWGGGKKLIISMEAQSKMQSSVNPVKSKGCIWLLELEGSFTFLVCFKEIVFPRFCSNSPNTLQGQKNRGLSKITNFTLNSRGHRRGWLTLKAEHRQDAFSKGIMDKQHVLQVHNSL